jgi:hypothetical protein
VSDLVFLLIMVSVFLTFKILIDTNWRCFFGFHQFVYIGQKHGMTWAKDREGVVGSQRNMYKCCNCNKYKPIEDKDYV